MSADLHADDPASLELLARELERLERVTVQWEPEKRAAVEAIRRTVDQITEEALRRLIRLVREDTAARPALVRAASDPWVHSVLTYHGLVRAPVTDRLARALARVRPTLASHGGDIEVERCEPPRVRLRLVGTCDGCAFAGTTSRELVEVAVRDDCPELTEIEIIGASHGASTGDGLVALRSGREAHDVCGFDELHEGKPTFRSVGKVALMLTRVGDEARAYPNACAHLGMPLDDAPVENGIISCRYHGFRYALDSGECLTVREIALPRLPVAVIDGRVRVDLGRTALRGRA
ncbi:MAG: NifU family protein [Deltaproteobacteria bacterium]|nr:NifU family protein [Deltaproteobacteria bacterium]